MRHFGKLLWLTPLVLLGAVAGGVAAFCGGDPKPIDAAAIKLPGAATRGVLSGDHFYTIIDSRVMDVDLKQRQATEKVSLTECYDYLPVAPFVDVADGKACVASGSGYSTDAAVHVIDLRDGTILHSAKYKGEVHGLGFAGDDRVFVLGRTDVTVVDVASGETVQTIPMRKEEPNRPVPNAGLSAYQKVGKLLYIADSGAMRIKVIDLEAGKALDDLGGDYCWYTGLQVVGDKAFVRSVNLSYGIDWPEIRCYDLKTKKFTAMKDIKLNVNDHVPQDQFDRLTLVAGPDDGVCLRWADKVYQYDSQGRQVGETTLAKDDDGRLVGVWNGQALTAGKDSLRLTPLAKATAKSD